MRLTVYGTRISDHSRSVVKASSQRQKAASGLAWNTVKNIISALSAVYAAAVKYGYLKVNPARSAELSQEPVRLQPRLPSDEELQQLQNALDDPHKTMVWLACATGVRVSELLALRWGAIDWERKCLWVREAVHDGRIDSPKTHRSQRPILLTESDLARLRQFRKRAPEAKDKDWLFPNTAARRPFGPITCSRESSNPQQGIWGSPT
jgi:integrase